MSLLVFFAAYTGIALGGIPGLKLDRTGIALLGAIMMIAVGGITLPEATAAIHAPTILLLFGLMIVSAQLRSSGFYDAAAAKLSRAVTSPHFFLLILMCASAVLSAVLVNDIICLAFTPMIAMATLRAGLNPIPFLLGLAFSSNIGSAATLIGNPQNMLIGQMGGLDFGKFLGWCAVPVVLALVVAYGMVCVMYRQHFHAATSPEKLTSEYQVQDVACNIQQTRKGLLVVCVAMIFFFTSLPRELTALAAGGLLLFSRRTASNRILGMVDWQLITLFCALFVLVAGFEKTGLPEYVMQKLNVMGCSFDDPFFLTGASALLSNLVSNVPAVMLLTRWIQAEHQTSWYLLALTSTFAGNLITIGSIANLIVIEQARTYGVVISFREHARSGILITLITLLIAIGWFWVIT